MTTPRTHLPAGPDILRFLVAHVGVRVRRIASRSRRADPLPYRLDHARQVRREAEKARSDAVGIRFWA